MPYLAIKKKHNAGYVVIKPDNGQSHAHEISAILSDGSKFHAKFGGFLEGENVVGLRKVKLVDVYALTTDPDAIEWHYDIPRNHYVVGTYLTGLFYILLFDGKPKHFKLDELDSTKRENVVVGIFDRK